DDDTIGYLENFKIANPIRQENSKIMDNLARAYALNHMPKNAITICKRPFDSRSR
ncbi:MAG: hypothetical protein ACJATA_000645, partial [Sphingobacteriales bacterium]